MKSIKNRTIEDKLNFVVNWIRKYLEKSKAKGIVFGVSGGIDSALISAIASKYFPENHLALSMDINNSSKDIEDSRTVINHFKLKNKVVDLEPTFKQLTKSLDVDSKTHGNIKSRLRMITLYSYAQEHSYLVLGTSNYNEIMIGYFTKYGDSGADIIPLANLIKGDIIEMSKFLNVPKKIIEKKPTAGLYENQTDEEDIGISYNEMDKYFLKKNNSIKDKMKKMINNTKHKRKFPPSPLKIGKIL